MGRNSNLGTGPHLLLHGVQDGSQRLEKLCALGDVHPDVTAKLIHFSLSCFHWITVTTCDDERESSYWWEPLIRPRNDSHLGRPNFNSVTATKLDLKSYYKEIQHDSMCLCMFTTITLLHNIIDQNGPV